MGKLLSVSCNAKFKVALGTFVANAVRVEMDPAKVQAGLAAAGGSMTKAVSAIGKWHTRSKLTPDLQWNLHPSTPLHCLCGVALGWNGYCGESPM